MSFLLLQGINAEVGSGRRKGSGAQHDMQQTPKTAPEIQHTHPEAAPHSIITPEAPPSIISSRAADYIQTPADSDAPGRTQQRSRV